MRQVYTQAELRAALLDQESEIQVTGDFDIDAPQNITYNLLLRSSPSDTVHTLFKTANFSGSLFRVSNGGSLTIENLVLDGSAAGSYEDNPDNRTLVQAMGGSIHLGYGAVLQNNSSYQEGGGLYLSGDSSYVNTLLMDGDAVIRGCSSRNSGGGLTAALRNNGDSVRLTGSAVIEGNTAANGAGAYFRSYLAEIGGAISIGEQVQIRNNQASVNGGGVYFSGFSSGGGAPMSLTVEGEASISSNQATSGGGIYFYSANPEDQLFLTDSIRIAENIVTENGGGVYLSAPRDGVFLSIQGASITDNQAKNGGGVYLRSAEGGTLNIIGQTTISGNVAAGDAVAAGGGLWIQNVSATLNATFSNASLLSNRASANGGGLFLSNSGEAALSISDSSISRNTAGGSGGGAYLIELGSGKGTIDMENTTLSDNAADTSGGGLYLGSGTGELKATLNNCTVNDNTADSNSGGGIWSGGSSDSLLIRGDTLITQNSSREGNGGGVYFNSDNGELILSDNAKITYNQALARESSFGGHGGGISVVPGRVEIRDQVEIAYNSASRFGGGLSAAEESVIIMSGGVIHDNQSEQAGGGVWNHTSSQFTQIGGSIESNTAPVGGGIYNDSTASILGGVIQGNTASQYAAGVYNAGELYTQGQRELENGLYIANRDAVAYLIGALEEGTTLQLENSDYVAPNSSGDPIVVGEATAQYPLLTQTDAEGFRKPPTGFDGWEIRLSDDGNQVLLAPLNYTLRYENTIGVDNPNPDSYTSYTPITLLPLTDIRFLGWFDTPEGGTQVTEIPIGSTGDKVLYAMWRSVEHTITYHGNDEVGPPAQCIPLPQIVSDGEVISLPDSTPARKGFRFVGWNTRPDGSGTRHLPGESFGPVLEDTELYAEWEKAPTHTIFYCANDDYGTHACCVPCPEKVLQGQSAQVSCCIPRRIGYCFVGWNTHPCGAGQMVWPCQTVGPVTGDIYLYAQWERLPLYSQSKR